jgi:Ca2+-binding EF-hand superfamily protein
MMAKDGKVDVMEVKNLFYENSRKKLTAVEFLFRVLGKKMDEHDTGISLVEYLTKVSAKRTADNYNLVLFSDTFSGIFCTSLGESEDLFKYIDSSSTGTVAFGQIEVAINKFRSDIRGEMETEEPTMKVPAKAPGGRRRSSVNAVIDDQDPGWLAAEKALAKMKVQDEPKAVVEKLREAFKFLEINSTFLYDLADSHQLNSVPVSY